MKNNKKITILRAISIICEVSAEDGFSPATITKLENELSVLSDYLSITGIQAWFMAMIFGLRYKNSTVDVNDIASNCKMFYVLNGKAAVAAEIVEFCRVEKLDNGKGKRIGYQM